jgi:hypothetical protein
LAQLFAETSADRMYEDQVGFVEQTVLFRFQ